MRPPLLLAGLIALTLIGTAHAVTDPGVPHLAEVKVADLNAVASGQTPVTQFALTYRYTNQWGIDKIWQIQGTTLLIQDSVHTAVFADQARQALAGGGQLTGAQQSVFDLEYGNWDKFSSVTLTAADVKSLCTTLATSSLLAAPARAGCGENAWEVTLKVNGKRTQIFDVNAPGNDQLMTALPNLKAFLGQHTGGTAISATDFAHRVIQIVPAGGGS